MTRVADICQNEPMPRIAILFAFRQESAPLEARMRDRRPHARAIPGWRRMRAVVGNLHGRELLIAVGGMGPARAAGAAAAILEDWSPDLLVIAGVAGALREHLAIGDLAACSLVVSDAGELVPDVVPPALGAGNALHTGALLSLERVLISAVEKREAARRDASLLAVEMETAAAATAAIRRGQPWSAVRAISDGAGEDLPLDFNRLRNRAGDLHLGSLVAATAARPSAIPGLLRLGRNTARASERLADYLETWVRSL